MTWPMRVIPWFLLVAFLGVTLDDLAERSKVGLAVESEKRWESRAIQAEVDSKIAMDQTNDGLKAISEQEAAFEDLHVSFKRMEKINAENYQTARSALELLKQTRLACYGRLQ